MLPLVRYLTLCLLLFASLSSWTTAGEGVVVHDAWARATAPGSPNGAGYLTLSNHSDQPQTFTGARFAGAGKVEIHRSTLEDGMGRMERIREGIRIAPGESLTLAPGGYHLMLLDLEERLVAGEKHDLVLEVSPAGDIHTRLHIRSHDSAGGSNNDNQNQDHHHHH